MSRPATARSRRAVAFLILAEIAKARRLSLVIPMPRDPRLLRVCHALLADPANGRTLDGWVGAAGAARTLARLFEAELGLSFATWRQRVRFHNALEAIVPASRSRVSPSATAIAARARSRRRSARRWGRRRVR